MLPIYRNTRQITFLMIKTHIKNTIFGFLTTLCTHIHYRLPPNIHAAHLPPFAGERFGIFAVGLSLMNRSRPPLSPLLTIAGIRGTDRWLSLEQRSFNYLCKRGWISRPKFGINGRDLEIRDLLVPRARKHASWGLGVGGSEFQLWDWWGWGVVRGF